jgi:hypothetical protein
MESRKLKALVLGGILAVSINSWAINIGPETVPLENDGALSMEDLGPVFARPLEEENVKPMPPASQPAPRMAENTKQPKDIQSLFDDNSKPKAEERNPLEEQARNELKAMEDPEGPKLPDQMMQLGENTKQPDVTIKDNNLPKEIELDNDKIDNQSLPTILR